MSSRAIYGKPGGGKSQLAVMWLLSELENTTRPVITNIPLKLDKIVDYLTAKGRTDIDVYGRVRLLDFDEVRDFWRFRSVDPDQDHPPLTKEQIRAGDRPPKSHFAGGGVAYYLDELHRHLNSRQWKETGPVVLDYITMHRHYGDDVVWMTQAVGNVDSQWRSVTQDYTLVRNYGKEAFRGFRKGSYFEWLLFLDWAEDGSLTPQETGTWKLDPDGAASCYDTSDVGGKADTGQRKKGLHIYWLYGGVLAICALVAAAFMILPNMIGKKMAEDVAAKERAAHPVAATVPARGVSQVVPQVGSQSSSAVVVAPPPSPSPTPRLMRVVAVPLKFSAADAVRSALLGDKQYAAAQASGDTLNVTASADNTALIVSGDNAQEVVGLAQVVREYDVRCAMVSVHCVIARRQVTKGHQIGLFGFLQDVGSQSSQNGSSDLGTLLTNLAVDLGTGVATMGGTFTAQMALDAFTRFVATDSDYEVVSHPTLVMLSGRQAVFSSGRQIPVPTTVNTAAGSQTSVDYKNAEFSFKVQPTVLPDGRVHLEISQDNTDVLSTTIVAGSEVPTLSTQSLQSSVDLSDRQLLYLGGIMVDSRSKSDQGTPVLRRIPIVNWVFGQRQKTVERDELFVVVTAEVWKGNSGPVRVERAEPVPVRKALAVHPENLW